MPIRPLFRRDRRHAAGARPDRARRCPAQTARDGRCRSPTSTASATCAISTSRPTAPGSPTRSALADVARDKDEADLWLSNWAGTEHVRLTTSPDARVVAALQPRRQVDCLPVRPAARRGRQDQGRPDLAPQPPGRRGAPADRSQGRRQRLRLVARFGAAGVRRRRSRSRRGQGRRRQDAQEADRHRPLRLQARQRRLPRRTAARTSTC